MVNPSVMNLSHYIWKGLDTDHFDVIDIKPQNSEHAVIVMRDNRQGAYKPWCAEYLGSGHYYFTKEEMYDYCHSRKWKGF